MLNIPEEHRVVDSIVNAKTIAHVGIAAAEERKGLVLYAPFTIIHKEIRHRMKAAMFHEMI